MGDEPMNPPRDYSDHDPDNDFWHDDREAREPLTGIWLGVIIAVLHFGVLLAVMFLALWIGPVYAHQAPLGWSYGIECCSLRDCRQAGPDEIRVTPTGYQLVTTGEVVEFTSRRIKQSQDQFYHVCQQGGNFDSGRILCIYVPPVSG